MSEVTYFILYILQHNKGRHQPFWSDPLNPIFCLYLLFFLAGTLRSLPVQVRLLFVLAAARGIFPTQGLNLGLLHCRQILNRLS